MDITEFTPVSYLQEFFQLPAEIIILIIFISGYLTLRYARRTQALKPTGAIDDVFLISISGTTWFLRIALIIFWIYNLVYTYYSDINTFKKYQDVALPYVFGLIVLICLMSNTDLKGIRRRPLLSFHNPRPSRYWPLDRIRIWFESHRFVILIIYTLGIALFLSYGMLSHGLEGLGVGLFYLFMLCLAFIPTISLTIRLLNKILD